jgi:hypothetical protein
MNLNQIFIILLAIILIWWPIGGVINRRRAQHWLDWLQVGVKELGTTSSVQWLRPFHSVGQLTVKDPLTPFRSFDVLFTLESRENLITWGFRHLRGRRDDLIVQADLLDNPVQELEVGYHGRKSYDVYLTRQEKDPFTELGEQDGFRIARRGKEDRESIERLRKFLADQGKVIQRMSLQRATQGEQRLISSRKDKNLLLRADMTKMDAQSPSSFFAALREWAANLAVDAGETTDQTPR